MTELNPIYGSPFVQKEAGSELFEMMRHLKRKNPRAAPQKVQKLWVEEVLDDRRQTEFAVRAEAINVWTQVDRLDKDRPRRTYVKVKAEREAERKQITKKAIALVNKTKSALLITVMGSTFGELAKLSQAAPQLAKISKMGKPNQLVSDVLSEKSVLSALRS